MRFDPKRKAGLERIKHLEQGIVHAKEYLESGKHPHWYGFRPWFVDKVKDGKKSLHIEIGAITFFFRAANALWL